MDHSLPLPTDAPRMAVAGYGRRSPPLALRA